MTTYTDPQAKMITDLIAQGMAQNTNGDVIDIAASRATGPMQAMAFDGIARPVLRVEDFAVPGPAGDIECRAWVPRAPKEPGELLPVLLYFTGGTFMTTSLDETPRGLLSMLAVLGDCIVAVPNHRKPPENKFPAAFDDCFATYRWLVDNAQALGGDGARVAVMGESSGGTLAAAVCQDAKAAGVRQPVLQALFEPLLDLESSTPSIHTFADIIDKKTLDWGASLYFDDEWPDRVPRRASPLRADDVSGLAYAYIVTAEFDPLRDEGHAYAMRLRNAGVPVSYLCYEGQFHGFMASPIVVDESMVANHQFAGALRLAFEKAARGS